MEKLIELRKRKKLTQHQMAVLLKVSKSYYEKIECGDRNPSFNFISKVKEEFPEFDTNIFFTD